MIETLLEVLALMALMGNLVICVIGIITQLAVWVVKIKLPKLVDLMFIELETSTARMMVALSLVVTPWLYKYNFAVAITISVLAFLYYIVTCMRVIQANKKPH